MLTHKLFDLSDAIAEGDAGMILRLILAGGVGKIAPLGV